MDQARDSMFSYFLFIVTFNNQSKPQLEHTASTK